MNLIVVSHKPCWRDPGSPTGYVTDGGFPFQMEAIAGLFESTTLLVPVDLSAPPGAVMPLKGPQLTVEPLSLPRGRGWRRKVSLFPWMLVNLPKIWRRIRRSDAVHTPLAGDIGTFGAVIAWLQKKPLFIRYCGRWDHGPQLRRKLLFKFMIRIAGGRNVVLATGGDTKPPEPLNSAIKWIFASSLTKAEIENLPERPPYRRGKSLTLVTVARQEKGKNTDRIISALPVIMEQFPGVKLEIVGDGSELPGLKRLAADSGLEKAVVFHGYLDHDGVISVLVKSDLFCFPTDSEGFPKAVLEALACGLPVVTTPVSVLPLLIGDKNGILLPDIEPASIARAILTLAEDENRFNRLRKNARETAQQYTLENWQHEIGLHLGRAWGKLGHAD